jgi:asparagine synthase (glutamine-hydrolysing)
LARITQVELRNRLPELLLMRVDKMTMANSVEARVPFLDEDVVEFALKIPSQLKGKGGEPKYVLKKAAEGILPNEIVYRKKWGFCGSATNILTDGVLSYAREKVLKSALSKEIFHAKALEDIFERHRTQKRFNSFKIWCLLNLVLWHERWFENA